MNSKAISFTPEVLKAKLRALEEYGRCMTRRPLTSKQVDWLMTNDQPSPEEIAPWKVGQLLWTRERAMVAKRLWRGSRGWKVVLRYDDGGKSEWIDYPSRLVEPTEGRCIANGVFREGARHVLEVVEARAERVEEISADAACLEGVDCVGAKFTLGLPMAYRWSFAGAGEHDTAQAAYFALYNSIYGVGAHARDWCWVYTLKRATP